MNAINVYTVEARWENIGKLQRALSHYQTLTLNLPLIEKVRMKPVS